jgi:hypothetical protein
MDLSPPIRIRPIRPNAAQRLRALLKSLSSETRYMRFQQVVTDFTPAQ